MNILAVVGSPRKGKATDTLIEKAIDGVKSVDPDCSVKKLHLTDYSIQYCKNCLVCRDRKTDDPVARCTIRDDMDEIHEYIQDSDALIIGTPVHSAYVTAPMATFLERITWTHAKSEGKIFMVQGCPVPRSEKKRKAVIIVVSGIIPPLFRRFCDEATPHIKDVLRCSLNAKSMGTLYAGDIEHRGVEKYYKRASDLGKKLV